MIKNTSVVYLLILLITPTLSWRVPRSLLQGKLLQSNTFSSYLKLGVNRMAFSDDPSSDAKKVDSPRASRPPIIPFDFARDDIVVIPKVEKAVVKENDEVMDSGDYVSPLSSRAMSNKWVDDADLKTAVRSANNNKRNKWVEDPSRPTGYGNVDEDDDDWVPSADSEGVEKFLKDYFFNSPYDSPKRRDAKFVIRNVTLISGVLGTIFTILFYAFPGRFISYRGTADFSQRYSSDFINKDPSELLNDKVNEDLTRSVEIGGATFFDDGVGVPVKDDIDGRIPYQKKPSDAKAPGRTENL